MKQVSVLGLGLMGASLCLAMKRKGSWRVHAYARREETRSAALEGGFVDEVFDDPQAAVRNADIVVIGAPVLVMKQLAEACAPGLKKGAIVTDVGSTKEVLGKEIPPLLDGTGAVFIGSHPVCGSEKTGLEAAIPDLYEGALVVVCPNRDDKPSDVEQVETFWKEAGARVFHMSAFDHDAVLARTSHLPHLAAVLLALAVGRNEDDLDTGGFCGTGFSSATRLAAGSAEVWKDISESNRDSILSELRALGDELSRMTRLFEEGDYEALKSLLASGTEVRQQLLERRKAFMKELDR